MLSLLQVEKNDEAEQKAEQDANKPEEKAHKAATKIQASFRGHITRKKLKGEKKEEGMATLGITEVAEKKENAIESNGTKTPATEQTMPNDAKPKAADKEAGNSEGAGSDARQAEEGADSTPKTSEKAQAGAATTEKEKTPTDSKDAVANAKPEGGQNPSAENPPAVKVEEAPAKGEPKQADVPTASQASETTPKPQMETATSVQTPGKTGGAFICYTITSLPFSAFFFFFSFCEFCAGERRRIVSIRN
ncbi:neuromodulin [Latimeria chalumnae]|uniref:neuromodulin n=1 Tax=Latimeria chalumnae TaxID=7897 RepID=UPI00313E5FD5